MILTFHGGMCCGIKTIYSMGWGKEALEEKVPALKQTGRNSDDIFCRYTKTSDSFFTDEAPEESRVARLDRYIKFVRRHRPQHIIEIVLATDTDGTGGQAAWIPHLEKLGFKLVTQNRNSNSGNLCNIFHLNIN